MVILIHQDHIYYLRGRYEQQFKEILMRVKKIINSILNRIEYKLNRTKIISVPTIYTLGTSNICNLKCPMCVTGIGGQDKPLKFMDFELFSDIINKIKDYAILVQLYNWGEPFLHKDIIEMLKLCNEFNLNTEVSSNLSIKNIDEILEAIVKYRLKKLIVSFDGLNQEDYERYRVKGDITTVLENVKKINNFKKQYRSEFPIMQLQYLENKYTTTEKEIIHDTYKDLGFDEYVIYDMLSMYGDQNKERLNSWFTKGQIENNKYLDMPESMLYKKCTFLYNQMIVEQDGSIAPCCFTTNIKDDFTNWDSEKSINDMYNSIKFQEARKMFKTKVIEKNNTCAGCSVFKSYIRGNKND